MQSRSNAYGKGKLIAAASAAIASYWLVQFNASAASITWSGAGSNDNLSLGANWVGNAAPAVADAAFFTGTPPRISPVVDVPIQYASLTFDAQNASAFTFGGTSTLTLGASPSTAGTLNNIGTLTGLTQTFNNAVAMYAGTINANTGGFVFNNVFNIGNGGTVSANAVTIRGGAVPITFNGGLTSSINAGSTAFNVGTGGGSIATYTGTMTINGASSMAGNVNINGGAVRINNSAGLGTGSIFLAAAPAGGGTGQGVLELTGNITLGSPVQMNGRDNATVPHFRSTGNNTISNLYGTSGGAFHVMESTSGLLTISNYTILSAVGSARTIAMGGAGDGIINAWAPANATIAHNVQKNGTGQWTLGSGMNSTGSFGNVTVNGGTLVIGQGLGARVIGSATIATGGTLKVITGSGTDGASGNNMTPTIVRVQTGGNFDVSSFSQYSLQAGSGGNLGQQMALGGTVTATAFKVWGDNALWLGNNNVNGAIGTGTISGELRLTNQFAATNGGVHFDLANTTTIGGGVNDLLEVQGNLNLDGSSGQNRLYINPIAGSLATGTYRLIDYTGSLVGSAGDLVLSGNLAGTTRQSFNLDTSTAHQVNLVVSGSPANLVWKGNVSGDWDVVGTANWLNGAVGDKFFQGDNVTFDDTTANNTVNIGTVVLPSSITVNTSQTYTFVGSGSISGATGITKNGTGTLLIANSGTNDFAGPIAINNGTLQIGGGTSEGSIGGGTLTNNGNLVVNKGVAFTIPGAISGSGTLIQRGPAALTLSGNSTYTGQTIVESSSLQISNNNALGDVVAGTTVNSGGQLFSVAAVTTAEPLNLNGDGPVAGDGALRAGGATTTNFNGAITLAGNTTFKVDGGATMNITSAVTGSNTTLTLNADANGTGVITGSVNLGNGSVTKNGAGAWVLANSNIIYSGPTAINAGVLQYGNGTTTGNATIPTAPITLSGGTIAFNNTGSYAVSADISGTGGVAVGTGGSTVTLTGNLSGFNGMLTTLNGGTNSMLVVPVATNAGSIVISDVNLTGVGQGIIRLTNSNAIANNATMEIQTSQAGGTGRLEVGNGVTLNFGSIILHPRNNATPTILATDGNNTINGPIRINTGGTFVNLQANAGASLTVTGTIRPATTGEGDVPGSSRALVLGGDGNGTFAGSITNQPANPTTISIMVQKSGTGTWRLSGTNDYVGNIGSTALPPNAATIVQAGKLIFVGSNAWAPVLANTNTSAYSDIQGGRLVLDYSGGSADPAALVLSVLDAGFDQTPKFSAGIIRTTNAADPAKGLGSKDDTSAKQVSIGYTYYGDANLDGQVDVTDLGALATNWQASGVWSAGDFNYDGFVDVTDLGALATNWQQGVGNPLASQNLQDAMAAVGLGNVAVPEPASVGAIGVLLAGVLARRSRR